MKEVGWAEWLQSVSSLHHHSSGWLKQLSKVNQNVNKLYSFKWDFHWNIEDKASFFIRFVRLENQTSIHRLETGV